MILKEGCLRRNCPLDVTKNGATTWFIITLYLMSIMVDFGAAQNGGNIPDLGTIPTPPSFKHEPNPPVMYFVVDSVTSKSQSGDSGVRDSLKMQRLICEADGYPEPKCHWLKDGRTLDTENNERIEQQEGFGTITIRRFEKSDEGVYQCYCQNDNGTAYDRSIQLTQTYINYFPQSKGETIPVRLGEPFSRTCTPPDSMPPARIFWIYMGAGGSGHSRYSSFNSVNSSHITMNDKGSIFLQHVKEEDGLTDLFFTCTVENTELKDFKFGDQFKIQVIKQPGDRFPAYIQPKEQYISPREVDALKGDSLELFCIFSGFPVQTPVWRKLNGGSIDWTRVTLGTNFNKSLKIENVGFQDEGTYECSFRDDPVNHRARQFTVRIDAAPYWVVTPPQSVNSSEGETVQFECDAAGRPQPRFTFYKNGKELYPDNHHVFIDGPKLKIVGVRKGPDGAGDNAVYQCKAENNHGFVWANFYLNLLSFRPVLLAPPVNTVGIVGQDVTLSCRFFGSPRPTVAWRTPAILGTKTPQVEPLGVYKLRLYDVTKQHEGRYECYAENKHGNAIGEGYLTVRRATHFVTFPQDNTTVAGHTLLLPCKAEGDRDLKVDVTWLKYGAPINSSNSNGRYVIEDGNLRIDGPVGADSGEYTCVAHTKHDRIEKVARIIVRDVPQPPQTVHVQCDTNSAAVNFHYVESSQDATATEFWAQYNIDPENEPHNWETHPVPVSQLNEHGHGSVRVNLHPYGNFAFRVFARNDIGDSAPTAASQTCKTPSARPDKNPSGVLVKGNTPEDLTVYWEPMPRRDWNGPKFHYVVDYKRAGSGRTETKVIEDPYQSSVVFPVNEPYQKYEATVRSRNELGDSTALPETIKGHSGEETPKTAPTGFEGKPASSTIAKFTWKKYNASNFKGELKGFKVEHWTESSKRAEPIRKVAVFDPAATHGTVYDLKPYALNKARIMAYSGGGDGPSSQEIELDMPEGVPSPVRDLEVFALSNDEVGAIWQPPRELNGVFRGCNVSWCKIRATSGGDRVDFPSCKPANSLITSNYYRIDGLGSDIEYQVEVICHTRAGPGEPNAAVVRTLPLTAAEYRSKKELEMPSMRVVGIGDDHFNVTWIPGKHNQNQNNPVGNEHYAEYRLKGEDKWTSVHPHAKNFTIQITGLQPETTYEVRTVSVLDLPGGGKLVAPSNISELTTGGEAESSATVGWLIAIFVAILILIIILILVCLVVKNRGQKYPVSEKEKEQGREPMMKEEKGFGEYAKPGVDEEKRSLTAESKAESEADSMAEYGDGETGRFTEDGSFIGQYSAPNKVIVPPQGGGTPASTNGAAEKPGGKGLTTII